MTNYIKFFAFILFAFFVTFCKAQEVISEWTEKSEKLHLQNRQDTATWDAELLRRDIESNKERIAKPIRYGAFPVPKYELLGKDSFKGIGNGGTSQVLMSMAKKLFTPIF